MNWYTRRRSLKPSQTSWTKPSPKCPDTKNNNHTVYTLLQTNFVNTTRCLHNKKTPLGSRLDSSEPLHILHSSILFLPETRAYNVPKNISFFVFVGPGQKANFTKQRNQPRYTPRSSPLSPHHKIKIIKKCVYLMKMSHLPSLKILTPSHTSSPLKALFI